MKLLKIAILVVSVIGMVGNRALAQPAAAPGAEDPWQGMLSYEYGKSRIDLGKIDAQIRTASPEQYKAIESKLIGVLQNPKASLEARRFACRWLQIVGTAQCVPVVAPLIADEKISHMARVALESIPDPSAGAALRAALGQVKGQQLAGVIGSVAARRDAQAVSLLAPLAAEADAVVAGAAITALGQIGTPEAAQALAAVRPTDALKPVVARAQIESARALASAGNRPQAIATFNALLSGDQPRYIRVAAFTGLVATQEPASSAKLVIQTLAGNDAPLRNAALSAVGPAGDMRLRNAVAEQLPGLKPEAQAALLSVLADQAEVTLRPTLLSILRDATDPAVREAALEAMVYHGEGTDVAMLVKAAAAEAGDKSPSRKTLTRMTRTGVDEALLSMLQEKEPALRAVVVAVLAERRTPGALSGLVKAMGDTDAGVVNESIKALSSIGTASEVQGLAQVVITTTEAARRDAAANAIKSISGRTNDKAACSGPVLAALAATKDVPAQSSLVQVLPRIGDAASLAALVKVLADAAGELRDAAVRALAEWPDMAAGTHLIQVARAATSDVHAVLALRGAVRLARNAKDRPAADRLKLLKDVIALAKRTDEKKQAIAAMAEVPSAQSLETLQGYLSDPALKNDAAMAALRGAKEMGPIYRKAAMATLAQVKDLKLGGDIDKQIDSVATGLKQAGMTDGFVLAWLTAGPFKQGDKDFNALLNVAFPPEKDDAAVAWRPVAADSGSKIIDLNKVYGGGDNCAAYLKTIINSDTDQDVQLEFGSDDGIKVLLNQKQIHSKQASRPVRAGEDKVKVKLKKGANVLLLKITQGGGDWGACARIRSSDGKSLAQGISVSLAQE